MRRHRRQADSRERDDVQRARSLARPPADCPAFTAEETRRSGAPLVGERLAVDRTSVEKWARR